MINQVRVGRGQRYNCKLCEDQDVNCVGYCRCLLPKMAAINSSLRCRQTPFVHQGVEAMFSGLGCGLLG